MRRSCVFIAALAAALASIAAQAGAAWADEPTKQVVTLHRDIPSFIACPYGPLNASFDLTRDITIFTENGTPVRETIHAFGTGAITNPATGHSLGAFVERVIFIDLTTGGAFTVGYNVRVPLAAGGTAIIGGGQLVFDASGSLIAAHGPDTASEISQVCAALAP